MRIVALLLLVVICLCETQCSGIKNQPRQTIPPQPYDELGDPIATIRLEVETGNREIYADGKIPSVNIEDPDEDIARLVMKHYIVLLENKITIILDRPLKNPYKFTLTSEEGFSRAQLVEAISTHYKQVYAEEERTATIKTIPPAEREMGNRNETNGIYGICCYDLDELFLTEIYVHRSRDNNIVLRLQIEP